MFYPTDAVAAERATELAANTRGIAFIRTGRPACPVIYSNDEKFEIGKGKVTSVLNYTSWLSPTFFEFGASFFWYKIVSMHVPTVGNSPFHLPF